MFVVVHDRRVIVGRVRVERRLKRRLIMLLECFVDGVRVPMLHSMDLRHECDEQEDRDDLPYRLEPRRRSVIDNRRRSGAPCSFRDCIEVRGLLSSRPHLPSTLSFQPGGFQRFMVK